MTTLAIIAFCSYSLLILYLVSQTASLTMEMPFQNTHFNAVHGGIIKMLRYTSGTNALLIMEKSSTEFGRHYYGETVHRAALTCIASRMILNVS